MEINWILAGHRQRFDVSTDARCAERLGGPDLWLFPAEFSARAFRQFGYIARRYDAVGHPNHVSNENVHYRVAATRHPSDFEPATEILQSWLAKQTRIDYAVSSMIV